ncbi:LOW QUALITY PROTEIN: hypothetical protein MAR_035008, partial [Mya arenaria]
GITAGYKWTNKWKKKNSGHKTGYNPKWKEGRPWLQYKIEDDNGCKTGALYCAICTKYKQTSSTGPRAWVDRLDKIKEHENSAQHNAALSESLNNTLDDMAARINTEAGEAILNALHVLKFILDKIFLSIYLTDLCIKVGSPSLANLRLAKIANYTSWDIVNELLQILSDEVQDEITRHACSSDSFAIMVNEVCDLTTTKHMAVCCRYINDEGVVQTSFLSDKPIASTTANNLVENIVQQVEDSGLNMAHMTGFASDGAAVFTGRKTGFGNLDKTLENLYFYYKYSSARKASLHAIQEAFNEVPVAPKQAKHHRWLSHENAVKSVVRSYRCIVADLEAGREACQKVDVALAKLERLRDGGNWL